MTSHLRNFHPNIKQLVCITYRITDRTVIRKLDMCNQTNESLMSNRYMTNIQLL